MSIKKIKQVAKSRLKQHPLWDDAHLVLARTITGGIWIGYRTIPSHQPRNSTHFDVNILGGTFFVLDIAVVKEERGKGHGAALYVALEDIARSLGCEKVQMNPSGWTPSGETRKSYLLRRGYVEFGSEVVKSLKLVG